MTIHNEAKKEDIARIVLMPGDPLRAQWIAQTFLEDTKCVNKVRNMLTFTGIYRDKKVTIMPHGMGIPSIGIYSYELMHEYDTDYIIRVGSCGALTKDLKVGEVVIAEQAYSESTYAKQMGVHVERKILNASPKLVNLAKDLAHELNVETYCGRVVSEDAFYQKIYKPEDLAKKHKIVAVDMEAFGLYANAIVCGKQALTLLTVSDSLITNESMSPEERQTSFKDMIKLALEMAHKLLG